MHTLYRNRNKYCMGWVQPYMSISIILLQIKDILSGATAFFQDNTSLKCLSSFAYLSSAPEINIITLFTDYLDSPTWTYTENKWSSYWQPFRHWLHLRLSEWQPRVQPVTRRLSIWRPFGFSVSACVTTLITRCFTNMTWPIRSNPDSLHMVDMQPIPPPIPPPHVPTSRAIAVPLRVLLLPACVCINRLFVHTITQDLFKPG